MFRSSILPLIAAVLVLAAVRAEPAVPTARMQHPSSDEAVTAVAFSPDGRTLISKCSRIICLWQGGKLVRQVKEDHSGPEAAVSPDGKTLASAGLWDIEKVICRQKLPEETRCMAFSLNGRTLALGCDDGSLRTWDVRAGKEFGRWAISPDGTDLLAFSPDGKALAVGEGSRLRLIDIATGKELRNFRGHRDSVNAVLFAPDGKTLISGSRDQTIRSWDVSTGKENDDWFGPHQTEVHSLALSPDGRTLASGGSDRRVRLWEMFAAQEICQFKGHQGTVRSLSFSQDGTILASGGDDGAVLLWDVTTSPRPARLDLWKVWANLCSKESSQAHPAVWAMIARPKESVAFLKDRLKPVQPVDPNLLVALDSNSFTARQKASVELERLGEHAEATLERILANKPPLEMKRRVEAILARISKTEYSPAWRGYVRSLQVIERVNDVEARRLLQHLASGTAESRWTKEAKVVLERVDRRTGRKR